MSRSRTAEQGMRLLRAALSAAWLAAPMIAEAQSGVPPLALEAKIPLGAVSGRIDHLAVDVKRRHLFVAELGNDSLGVVDLAGRRIQSTIPGLKEPQGVGYEPSTDTVYVANAGDGSVRILRAADLTPLGRIDLGDDADNVRVDHVHHHVLVGYGNGALAVIDPVGRAKLADIRLKAHPESLQIDERSSRAFVNLPDSREITVVDLAKGEAAGAWQTRGYRANFPMALDHENRWVLVVFRSPARLVVMSAVDGALITDTETCGDADDVFVDAKRHRVYVSCGAGRIDVFEEHGGTYQRLAQIDTAPGARTSLFVPELDRLYLAARTAGREPAAIWVLRPMPAASG